MPKRRTIARFMKPLKIEMFKLANAKPYAMEFR
jgi:hypothetical protein